MRGHLSSLRAERLETSLVSWASGAVFLPLPPQLSTSVLGSAQGLAIPVADVISASLSMSCYICCVCKISLVFSVKCATTTSNRASMLPGSYMLVLGGGRVSPSGVAQARGRMTALAISRPLLLGGNMFTAFTKAQGQEQPVEPSYFICLSHLSLLSLPRQRCTVVSPLWTLASAL